MYSASKCKLGQSGSLTHVTKGECQSTIRPSIYFSLILKSRFTWSWNRPVLSKKLKFLDYGNNRSLWWGFKPTTDWFQIRRATNCAFCLSYQLWLLSELPSVPFVWATKCAFCLSYQLCLLSELPTVPFVWATNCAFCLSYQLCLLSVLPLLWL